MLTTSQKAGILAKVGIAVPRFPECRLPVEERHPREGIGIPHAEPDADNEQRAAAVAWQTTVENLHATYVAARAAKSLRDAQQAFELARLRDAAW